MSTGLVRLWAGVPMASFVLAVALLAHSFLADHPATGPSDVDVLVVDEADATGLMPGGTPPRGALDSTVVAGDGFAFNGWADFPGGASFVLVTSAVTPPPGARIRARSTLRSDVADVLQDPALLYSGYSVGGAISQWGAPRCLYLRSATGTRLMWRGKQARCA